MNDLATMIGEDPRKNNRTYPVNQPSVGITDPKPAYSTQGTYTPTPDGGYTDTGTGTIAGTPPAVSNNGLNIVATPPTVNNDGLNVVSTPPTVSNDGLNHPAQRHVVTTNDSVAGNRMQQQQSIADAYAQAMNGGGDTTPTNGTTLDGVTGGTGGGTGGGGGGYNYTTTESGTPYSDDYDLSEYLKQQAAARIEAELAQLGSAYDQSMRGYDRELKNIQQNYYNQRNQAAAQDAIARRNFDERAAASGLNSGTAGQADLARSAAYTGELARLGAAEENARLDVELQKANAQSQYEQAIAQARAKNDQDLASALYQELIRVQGLERQDALNAAKTVTSSGSGYRTGGSGGGGGNGTGAGDDANGNIWATLDALVATMPEGYADTWLSIKDNWKSLGFESAAAAKNAYALHKYDAGLYQEDYKPTLTAPQAEDAIKGGNRNESVLKDYDSYYGEGAAAALIAELQRQANADKGQPLGWGLTTNDVLNKITYSPRNEPLIWVEGTPPVNAPQYDADGNVVPSKYYFRTPTMAQLADYINDGVVKREIKNGKYVYTWA